MFWNGVCGFVFGLFGSGPGLFFGLFGSGFLVAGAFVLRLYFYLFVLCSVADCGQVLWCACLRRFYCVLDTPAIPANFPCSGLANLL